MRPDKKRAQASRGRERMKGRAKVVRKGRTIIIRLPSEARARESVAFFRFLNTVAHQHSRTMDQVVTAVAIGTDAVIDQIQAEKAFIQRMKASTPSGVA